MRMAMWNNLLEVEIGGGRIIHGGDLMFKLHEPDPWFRLGHPERHQMVLGNHDLWSRRPEDRKAIQSRFFGAVHGEAKAWKTNRIIVDDVLDGRPVRVMVSHFPQKDLEGADWNLYGHFHNNLARRQSPEREREWFEGSGKHLNVGVELHRYRPVTLQEAVDRRRAGEFLW